MIRLDVAEYCDECDDFIAAVEKPSKMFTEGEIVLRTDTIVSCAHRKRCEAIRRYLERRGIGDV